MVDLTALPMAAIVAAFAASAAVIAIAGTGLTRVADELADRTGLGEAMFGGIFLGAVTSLPGVVASVTAAANGLPELAVSNAVGGIAAQTAFLVVADLAYRGVNLEHAAASLPNLVQGSVLMVLLGLALAAFALPEPSWLGVSPFSIALLVAYGAGLRWVHEAHHQPMWGPRQTPESEVDEPEEPVSEGLDVSYWARLAGLGLLVAAAGWLVAHAGAEIAARTAISQSFAGGFLMAVATSLPELVTTVAAVRRGALTLAVGGILGGNTFDVLFLSASDVAYRPGSIYLDVSNAPVFLISITLVMTAILVLGLLRREKHGPANIGLESSVVLGLYVLALVVLERSGS